MTEFPDGINADTARVVIAWEIAKKAWDRHVVNNRDASIKQTPEEMIDDFTALFRKASYQTYNEPEK